MDVIIIIYENDREKKGKKRDMRWLDLRAFTPT
jgi:hypothetical protein